MVGERPCSLQGDFLASVSPEKAQQLLDKYRQGQCTPEEQALVDHWFSELGNQQPPLHFLSEDSRMRTKKQLFNRIYGRIQTQSIRSLPRRETSLLTWRVAASILLLLGLGWATFRAYDRIVTQPVTYPQQVVVSKLGERKQIILPDGSVVQLNGNTSVRFNQQFSDTARILFLEGEAFFQVTKDPKRPFTVWAGGLKTTALGTSFNIQAIKGRSTKVALVTGKVWVRQTTNKRKESWLLDPGRQLTFQNATGQGSVALFHPAHVLAWREGNQYFDDERLVDVLRDLSLRYQTPIHFNETALNHCRVTTRIDQHDKLEDILRLLSFSHHLTIAQKAKGYVVTATGCP